MPVAVASPELRVGIVPVPAFTLLAFAGFVDTLRLAADEGDRSRPLRCRWEVLGERRWPVRASCGLEVEATADLAGPIDFDYLVVVGGTLHGRRAESEALLGALHRADRAGVPLVGLCTGSFTLARAGLMAGRRACVSWFHHHDYVAEFPGQPVLSDQLFLDDGDRITCAGGVSTIHLASYLVDRHCGKGSADKGLRIMIEEGHGGAEPQPGPAGIDVGRASDPRLRRALLAMERRLAGPLDAPALARAAGTSVRTLDRLFRRNLATSPARFLMRLRLERAEQLAREPGLTLATIAAECGFADASHLSRVARRDLGRRLRS